MFTRKSKHLQLSRYTVLTNFTICLLLTFLFCHATNAAEKNDRIEPISVNIFYRPNDPENATTSRLIDLMKEDKSIALEEWGGIELPGTGSKAALMMSIAGKTAPDVGESWFHIIQNETSQGFLYPLNEWIGDDTNGNGQIDDNEAKWPQWKKIPPLWRKVATKDGKVYGIPQVSKRYLAVIFRTDMIKAAGLNPNNPPKTWDELIYWCQKLSDPEKEVPGAVFSEGQRGIALAPYGFTWLPWMQSAGGTPIIQLRKSPTTGVVHEFSSDAVTFKTPNGEDLSNVKPDWRAAFASEAGMAAAGLYHKLRWMKWMFDPKTGEPINLTKEDIKNGFVKVKGREIKFNKKKDIISGVARGQAASVQRGASAFDMLSNGEVAMYTWFVDDLNALGQSTGLNPDLLSWFPIPAGPGPKGQRVVQIQNHYVVSYEATVSKSKAQRDRIWKTMVAISDEKTRDNAIREKVLSGLTRFVNPKELKRLGYDEYLREVPEAIKKNFEEIDNGKIQEFTEPWMGFWRTVDASLNANVLSLIVSSEGEDFDYKAELTAVEKKANSGMMFAMPKETLDKYRPYARGIVSLLVLVIVVLLFLIIRNNIKARSSKASVKSVYSGKIAWALVLPALLLIGLWRYYPLFRGMFMAFQDYKIVGESTFVGLDNFITLALDPSFWMSLFRTFYFVFLNMLLAFTAPIILAILLTDVSRFKILFRTLFFLPQMTSGIVIALLWKLMYNSTPQGFLNQLVSYLNYIPFVDIGVQSWLDDPQMAMICCVLPTVWASMGMASLIYLAALHSIPPDMYEAADVDGASIFSKMRHITIPFIMPLIIINFVGTFIATFQNMGNILVLTAGGPGEVTTVIGMKIWLEAYTNLRFSMATSMAWILGSLLIGFTYFQIKFLGKIEYKRAKEN